ncbi:MAG: hypothetical protein ACRYE7_02795 [Janthinobacterium lividum]
MPSTREQMLYNTTSNEESQERDGNAETLMPERSPSIPIVNDNDDDFMLADKENMDSRRPPIIRVVPMERLTRDGSSWFVDPSGPNRGPNREAAEEERKKMERKMERLVITL